MENVIQFPTDQVKYRAARSRLTDRLANNNFIDDEIHMIMEEVDEIINVSQFDLKEATTFVNSINGTYDNQVEIIGVLNDNIK